MKSINIKGKEYVEVNERILYFREHFADYALLSEIVSVKEGVVIIKATIYDPTGVPKATGYAYEKEDSTFINKTSYIENCETSAWGRALANFGIGIISAVASADEVVTAIHNQDEPVKDVSSHEDTRVGVGKHKEKHWSEVPIGYLEWALKEVEKDKPLYQGAKKEYDRRAVAPMEDDIPADVECSSDVPF